MPKVSQVATRGSSRSRKRNLFPEKQRTASAVSRKRKSTAASPKTEDAKKRKLPKTSQNVPKSKTPRRQKINVEVEVKKIEVKNGRRKLLRQVVISDETFSEGDFAYAWLETPQEGEEVESVCRNCDEEGEDTIIECDECAEGYHLKCLSPPLDEVPEGEWICDSCRNPGSGRGQNQREGKLPLCQRLFRGQVEVVKILSLWETGGTKWARVAWFSTPEALRIRRKKGHGKRELFASHEDDIEVESIACKCTVLSKREFLRTPNGNDVFYCEKQWKDNQFHPLQEGLVAGAGEEEEEEGSEGLSSGEEEFRPAGHGQEGEETEEGEETDGEEEEEEEEEEGWEEEGGERSRRRPKARRKGTRKTVPVPKAANRYLGSLHGLGAKRVAAKLKRQPETPLQRARAALMLSATPKTMTGRESERAEIAQCVQEAVQGGEQALGRCLYISGVPGTGKTATVMEVLRTLRARADSGEVPDWKLVFINALSLPSPNHAYIALYRGLTGRRVSWKAALGLLEMRFSGGGEGEGGGGKQPVVVVVDELDRLVTRTQTVLYNLFDWPTRPDTPITVIGISNTMDLPDRLLPRIVSRLGLKRCAFRPYTRPQIISILEQRLEGSAAADANAIKKVAMKVAAVSGDVRRALELCGRAAELAEYRLAEESVPGGSPRGRGEGGSNMIQMGDVDGAIREMFDAIHFKMLERCAKHEKLFLASVVCDLKRSGLAETDMERVAALYWRLCDEGSISKLTLDGLVTLSEDVSYVLKNDAEYPWLERFL